MTCYVIAIPVWDDGPKIWRRPLKAFEEFLIHVLKGPIVSPRRVGCVVWLSLIWVKAGLLCIQVVAYDLTQCSTCLFQNNPARAA